MESQPRRVIFNQEGVKLQDAFSVNRFEKIFTRGKIEELKNKLNNSKNKQQEIALLKSQLQYQESNLVKVGVYVGVLRGFAKRYEKAESMFTVAERFANITENLVGILPEKEHVFKNDDIDSIIYDITNKAPYVQLSPDRERKRKFESRHIDNSLSSKKVQKRIA